LPFQTPPQGWSPLFPATQAKAWAMFSWPFGPYAEALGSMFGANHQVSLVFQRAARAQP
jgi:hypothetical protein